MRPFATTAAVIVCLTLGGAAVSGCRAHAQETALREAASDFAAHEPPLCVRERALKPGPPEPMTSMLTPWIAGPGRYVVEGCGYRGSYVCKDGECGLQGPLRPAALYVEPPQRAGAVDSSPAVGAGRAGESPPSVPIGDADAATIRGILEQRRAEIVACVDKLPLGVQVDVSPARQGTISLRGPLKGKPEEACVRTALGQIVPASVQSHGTLIHVLK